MSAKIALARADNRYNAVFEALRLLKDQIVVNIAGKKRIVVKVNFTNSKNILSATHPDALKALLDFLKELTNEKITVAEAPFSGNLDVALKNLNYLNVFDNYNIEFKDLNKEPVCAVEVKNFKEKKRTIKLSKIILESDFLISLTPPKTHDYYILTLGLKNVAVGSTIITGLLNRHYRIMYHLGHKEGNILLAAVCKKVMPHLSVIDGWQAMEGNGPVCGKEVKWKIAIAGLDALTVDCFTAEMMGVNCDQIGYLHYLLNDRREVFDIKKTEVIGEQKWENFRRKFKLADDYERQAKWMCESYR